MGRKPGEFCWVELATRDRRKALAFYAEIFGWDSVELQMGLMGRPFSYLIARLRGRDIGAVYEMVPEQVDNGVVPHWLPYVAVESADRMVQRAEELGALCLVDPVDVFHTGRMSILEDPAGATFGVWQGMSVAGFGVSGEPGSPYWFELVAADTKRAADFYGALFGWTRRPSGGTEERVLLDLGGNAVAGMRALPAGMSPHWVTFFAADSSEAMCRRIQGSGGSVAITPAQNGVRFAAALDPFGAEFGILEPDPDRR